jgi:cytidyltransferase-like protein
MNNLNKKKDLINFLNQNKNKKIVLCHGVFDLVHYGHIMHFKSAKKHGDILVVSITKDKFIKKGINRPIFNETQRYNYLKELQIIDYVYICETESAKESIEIIKPNFYIKGPDYKNNSLDITKKIHLEKKLVEKFGGKIIYTNDEKFSSSKIINEKNLLNYNYNQRLYIEKIKNKFGYDYIKEEIKKLSKIKVLLVGELIFDKYSFGDIIGKSAKEPHLVLKKLNSEYYVGGTGAIARHLATFVNKIQLISPFGNEIFFKKILKKKFKKNVKFNFLKPYKNYFSIVKERFIDSVSNYKMFGSYKIPPKPNINFYKRLISKIKSKISLVDMIIISDYGHDFFNKKTANFISKTKKFKALNAQLNSVNKGYNSFNDYKNLDIVVINVAELESELRKEKLDIKFLANILMQRNKIKNLIVTKGKDGATFFGQNSKIIHCPAFVDQSIDKVGAGDAMLAIVAPALKQKIDPEIILFLGSIAAAISVKNIGNKVAVNYQELDKIIDYYLR